VGDSDELLGAERQCEQSRVHCPQRIPSGWLQEPRSRMQALTRLRTHEVQPRRSMLFCCRSGTITRCSDVSVRVVQSIPADCLVVGGQAESALHTALRSAPRRPARHQCSAARPALWKLHPVSSMIPGSRSPPVAAFPRRYDKISELCANYRSTIPAYDIHT
jgi:hypothetical protein